jgi:hypothetical protein
MCFLITLPAPCCTARDGKKSAYEVLTGDTVEDALLLSDNGPNFEMLEAVHETGSQNYVVRTLTLLVTSTGTT